MLSFARLIRLASQLNTLHSSSSAARLVGDFKTPCIVAQHFFNIQISNCILSISTDDGIYLFDPAILINQYSLCKKTPAYMILTCAYHYTPSLVCVYSPFCADSCC